MEEIESSLPVETVSWKIFYLPTQEEVAGEANEVKTLGPGV